MNHKGIAATRSKLLATVQGDFHIWVDSDDVLNTYALATLEEAIKKTNGIYDAYVYKFNLIATSDQYDGERQDLRTYEGPYAKCPFSDTKAKWLDSICKVIWNKCYKTLNIQYNHLDFDPSIEKYEDIYYTYLFLATRPNCYRLPYALYDYYKRPGSLTVSDMENNSKYYNSAIAKCVKELKTRNLDYITIEDINKCDW